VRLISALLILVCASVAQAQTEAPIVVNRSGVFYLLEGADGVPFLKPVAKYIIMGDAPAPPPVTPPTNPPGEPPIIPPPTGDEVGPKVREWTRNVDHPLGRQALVLIYGTVADKVADGSISVTQAAPAVRASTDTVFATIGGGEKWADFRLKVGDLANQLGSQGKLNTKEQMAAYLRAVKLGLSLGTQSQAALDPELLGDIEKLIDDGVSRLFSDGAF
jgi:hypothetical protein